MGDTKRLKSEFGDRLAFWGAIDTRDVLPFGSLNDVREEVRQRFLDLGPGGGYVVASSHSVTDDVPPVNYQAMIQATWEHGRY